MIVGHVKQQQNNSKISFVLISFHKIINKVLVQNITNINMTFDTYDEKNVCGHKDASAATVADSHFCLPS